MSDSRISGLYRMLVPKDIVKASVEIVHVPENDVVHASRRP